MTRVTHICDRCGAETEEPMHCIEIRDYYRGDVIKQTRKDLCQDCSILVSELLNVIFRREEK